MPFANQTILIIGGSSGFGHEVARQAARAGARLIMTGRDAVKLEKAAAALRQDGADVTSRSLDAANGPALERFFQEVESFDHLVSMAGGFMGGGFLDAQVETIRKAVDDKLFLNLAIARAAAPRLKDGGSMVFTAGSGGKPHNASGAIVGNDAIRTLVQGLAVELASRRCRVNAVAPTWTPTPLWRHMTPEQVEATDRHFAGLIPLGRTAHIAEVASAYVFLMENGFITGQSLAVDGGLTLVS